MCVYVCVCLSVRVNVSMPLMIIYLDATEPGQREHVSHVQMPATKSTVPGQLRMPRQNQFDKQSNAGSRPTRAAPRAPGQSRTAGTPSKLDVPSHNYLIVLSCSSMSILT